MTERDIGYAWLALILSGDSTLSGYAPGGVWRAYAPPGTATPFVILQHQGGGDVITVNAYRIMSDQIFQVKAVGPGSDMERLVNAAKRIDTLLGGPTSGSIPEGSVLSCNREEEIDLPEVVDGEYWQASGGLHRLLITRV